MENHALLSSSRLAQAALADERTAADAAVRRWEVLKRPIDVLGALLLILVLSPLLLGIAALLWRSGSVWFSHRRVGAQGREFYCYKFRTMVPDAEKVLQALLASDPARRVEWDQTRKLRKDPRVTRVGAFLRASSLDELPQLFNVLRGDMSLVGPRPVVREELALYGASAAYYLAVRPGMTGLWQVSGRSCTSYRRRIALDAIYVRRLSPWLDARILIRTVGVVLRGAGAY